MWHILGQPVDFISTNSRELKFTVTMKAVFCSRRFYIDVYVEFKKQVSFNF
jgi:hypothetical protein